MNSTPPLLPSLLPTAAAPPSPHGLGPVADDWEAAEVWLRAIAGRGRRNSPETVATYRYHLAKLRWYCETVARSTPSRWSVQDVDAFNTFLKELPAGAICARAETGAGFAAVGEAGYTPFRKRPSASSRADIQRCVHAMLRAWLLRNVLSVEPMLLFCKREKVRFKPARLKSGILISANNAIARHGRCDEPDHSTGIGLRASPATFML